MSEIFSSQKSTAQVSQKWPLSIKF